MDTQGRAAFCSHHVSSGTELIDPEQYPQFYKFSQLHTVHLLNNISRPDNIGLSALLDAAYEGLYIRWIKSFWGVMLSLGKQLPTRDFRLPSRSRPLKMVPIGSPETSVRNYHYSPRNNPEKRSSHLITDVQCCHLQCPTLGFFETTITTYPMKQRHNPDDIYLQEDRCENLQSLIILSH